MHTKPKAVGWRSYSSARFCRSLLRQIAILLLFSATQSTLAQGEVIAPGRNLEVVGVPSIPTALVRQVEPYRSIYGLPLFGWNPMRREIWLKGLSSVAWVSRVVSPAASPETTALYIQSGGNYDFYFQPQNRYLAYTETQTVTKHFSSIFMKSKQNDRHFYQTAGPETPSLFGLMRETRSSTVQVPPARKV